MSNERRLRIMSRLIPPGGPSLHTARLCDVCAELTSTTGAGIMLVAQGASRGSLSTSDAVSAVIEDLQFSLGEGPCIDACREGRPVLEPDLVAPERTRWLAFAPPAIAAGVRAVFGFPIRIGAVSLGALDLYRDRPGPLTAEQHADALVLADIAAETILLLQADASDGEVAAELERNANLHYVVHQASGMVSVQLAVSVDHALVRLRALAFSSGRPLTDLARSVVRGELRFEPHAEYDGGA
jgi:hypothetical protein